jgi:hypothetical protein
MTAHQTSGASDAVAAAVACLYDNGQVIYIPVRHHSPRCAHLTAKAIEHLRPDVVLIEAPCEANHLVPLLADASARPPLAIYLYSIEERASAHAPIRHRCFAPFAAMSPEWTALRTASSLGIEVQFIDLAFRKQLPLQTDTEPQHQTTEPLFTDDRLLANANPIDALVEEAQVRDFDEWWDRYFESGGCFEDTDRYFRDLHHFCVYLRLTSGAIDAQTRAREIHMAGLVQTQVNSGRRCVVVTGGFHSLGIHELLEHGASPIAMPAPPENGVHLVPYSLARLNRASGYAAGMPDAGYYDHAFQLLGRKREPTPFTTCNRRMVITLANELSDHYVGVTLPDAIEAAALSERLGQLRGITPGRPELRDAALTAFVKDSQAEQHQGFEAVLNDVLAGNAIGQLPDKVPLAPLVIDFRQQCTRLGLSSSASESKERHLDIYRSERHRAISRFLHQLVFLSVPYGERTAGPNFSTGHDLQRVRETWQFRWRVETEPMLTERSELGSSLEEAAANKVIQRLVSPSADGVERAGLVMHSLTMGLHTCLPPIIDQLDVWVGTESDPLQLGGALERLIPAYFAGRALDATKNQDLETLLALCFERFCMRLVWLGVLHEDQIDRTCGWLVTLFGLSRQALPWAPADVFFDAIMHIPTDIVPPKLNGLATAILMLSGHHGSRDTSQRIEAAFSQATLNPESVGLFMAGFLALGRARLLQEPALVDLITERILDWDETEFLEALPAMRLAFSQLSPGQLRLLGERLDAPNLGNPLTLEIDDLRDASILIGQVDATAKLWGLHDQEDNNER